MQQVTLKLKNYAENINIINDHNMQFRLLRYILWSLGALALVYVLVLGNMVFNIIGRKSLEANARILNNEVADLELSYLSSSNKIDLALSYSLGFKEIKTKFATRKTLGVLKLAKNEI